MCITRMHPMRILMIFCCVYRRKKLSDTDRMRYEADSICKIRRRNENLFPYALEALETHRKSQTVVMWRLSLV